MSNFTEALIHNDLPKNKQVLIGSSAYGSLKWHLSKHVLDVAMVPTCSWLFIGIYNHGL